MTELGNSIGYDMWNRIGASLTASLARERPMKVKDFGLWMPTGIVRMALTNAYR